MNEWTIIAKDVAHKYKKLQAKATIEILLYILYTIHKIIEAS